MSSAEDKIFSLLGHPTEPVRQAPPDSVNFAFFPSRSEAGLQDADVNLPSTEKSFYKLRKDEHFSVFYAQHAEIAAQLIQEFLECPTFQEFADLAEIYRDDLNAALYHYAIHVAITHRRDARHVRLPSIMAVFPERFITASDWAQCQIMFRDERNSIKVLDLSDVYTGTNLNEEHRLAYFREDPGVNLHHYHWHIVYPTISVKNIPRKDRQGELFYYMHEQMIARYNFERFSNYLNRVEKFVNWNEPIYEGYFPRLPATKSGAAWMPRQSNTRLKAISTENGMIDIMTMEHWRSRIYEAIHSKSASDASAVHGEIPLDNIKGIDVLGSLVEATDKSCNSLLYGSLHNMGHNLIANCHDPDGSLSSIPKDEAEVLSQTGVMADVSTACRDPVFYRWHSFINGIFQEHKNTLQPYTDNELKLDDVSVQSVEIVTEGKTEPNVFHTFWDTSVIDIDQGIDFAPKSKQEKRVRFKHLNHKDFAYKIQVMLNGTHKKRVTIRIFMAPMFDDRKLKMNWNDQKIFFIELDRFVHELLPEQNVIERKSKESSVTIPFEQQFRAKASLSENADDYCACGWPHYLLIPRGNAEGFYAQLFVMITDYDVDKVSETVTCTKGLSYCGVLNEKYPDNRPMGFPFDRNMLGKVSVRDVAHKYPNMSVTDVKIIFNPVSV